MIHLALFHDYMTSQISSRVFFVVEAKCQLIFCDIINTVHVLVL